MSFIRLITPPVMYTSDPTCGTCAVTLVPDGDGWECPQCGTSWSYSDGDGDPGFLPSQDETEGPALCAHTAFYAPHLTLEERARHTQACNCSEHSL